MSGCGLGFPEIPTSTPTRSRSSKRIGRSLPQAQENLRCGRASRSIPTCTRRSPQRPSRSRIRTCLLRERLRIPRISEQTFRPTLSRSSGAPSPTRPIRPNGTFRSSRNTPTTCERGPGMGRSMSRRVQRQRRSSTSTSPFLPDVRPRSSYGPGLPESRGSTPIPFRPTRRIGRHLQSVVTIFRYGTGPHSIAICTRTPCRSCKPTGRYRRLGRIRWSTKPGDLKRIRISFHRHRPRQFGATGYPANDDGADDKGDAHGWAYRESRPIPS